MKKRQKKRYSRKSRRRKQRYTPAEKQRYAARLRQRMTPAEVALWKRLKRHGELSDIEFKAQVVVCGYIPDFVEHNVKLAIEVDGPIHRYRRSRDHRRTLNMGVEGWKVIRYWNHQVLTNVDLVERNIVRAVRLLQNGQTLNYQDLACR